MLGDGLGLADAARLDGVGEAVLAAGAAWPPEAAAEPAAVSREPPPGAASATPTEAATATTPATATAVQRLFRRMCFKASASGCESRSVPPVFRSTNVGPFWLSVAGNGHSPDGADGDNRT